MTRMSEQTRTSEQRDAETYGNSYESTAYTRREQADNGRSLLALLRELRDEALTLVQQEFNLARAEVREEVREAKGALITSVVGAGVVIVGAFVLALAAAAGVYAALLMGEVSPLVAGWLAPLIVGLICTMVGLVMVIRGKKVTSAEHWRPERTERSVRETRAWAERKF